MHINALQRHLTSMYGEPIHLEGQTAYRWEITSIGPMPVYLCLTIEESTRRAAIWIFDPNKQFDQTFFVKVHDENDLNEAIETIRLHLPTRAY